MDDASVLSAMTGDNGILAGMRPDAIHIGTTTISPAPARGSQSCMPHKVAITSLAPWPASGCRCGWEAIHFRGGENQWLERSRPVMDAYANRIIPMGEDPAIAMSMKLVGNFMVASLIELIGEAYVFAESRGVDPSILTGMFKQFMPAASEYVDRICARDFERAGFTLDGGTKDVTLILEAAAEVHAPLSYASVVRDKCLSAQARGMGQLDCQ